MKTPTLDDMKLAVAKMLPDVLRAEDAGNDPVTGGIFIEWLDTDESVSEREWLHVCWLAEQKLDREECKAYHGILLDQETPGMAMCFSGANSWSERWTFNKSAEHRLEALCRVKHPEMFQ